MPVEEISSEDEEIVFLVVGDNSASNSQVADLIVAHEGAGNPETTKGGVRIFTSTSHKRVIVDTRVFPKVGEESVQEHDRQQIARQWISRNSLRRLLLDKLLSVVCVLTSSVDCEISGVAYKKKFAWLDILGVMFQEHKRAIWILVDIQSIDEDKLASAKQHIKSGLNRHGFINAIYWDLSRGEEDLGSQLVDQHHLFLRSNSVKLIRGDNVSSGDGNGSSVEPDVVKTPFLLREPALPKNPTSPTNTPWGPERVILFGRTGSGKSTLAQMLTKGKLEPDSEKFSSSSGIRGATKVVSYGQGRGWYVVDTPGFGEPNRGESTVPTKVAEDRIKKFVKTIDGLYAHFLYVVKKDRIDELEVRLWKFFVCLFGNDINDHFSIVISNADEEWVNGNLPHLSEIFKGCQSFLCAEFPSSEAEDEEWEQELQQIRMESLKRIENALAELSRKDVVCEFGDLSRTALMSQNGQYLRHVCHNAASFVMALCTCSSTDTLKVDQNIALLPT